MVMDAGGRILVSDAEREAVVARLHAATVEGRLTLDEFADRTTRAYASRTRADLAAVLDGLPALIPPGPPPFMVAPVPPVASRPSTSLPLVSMIIGILSVSAGTFALLSGPAGLVAVVLGILGLRGVRRGKAGSRGMAITGIVTGGIGIAAEVAMIVLFATLSSGG